jgi:hypothetical protein
MYDEPLNYPHLHWSSKYRSISEVSGLRKVSLVLARINLPHVGLAEASASFAYRALTPVNRFLTATDHRGRATTLALSSAVVPPKNPERVGSKRTAFYLNGSRKHLVAYLSTTS